MRIPARRLTPRLALLVAAWVAIVIVGSVAGGWATRTLGATLTPEAVAMMRSLVLVGLVAYVVLTAFPFVPGVEIGLLLLVALGAPIAPVVYLATVLSLTLAFAAGRLVPEPRLAAAFGWLGLEKARRLVETLAPMTPDARAAHLSRTAPQRWAPFLLRYRLAAIALAINLPGSALFGGGGGVSLAAGMSRLVSFPQFLLTVCVAVAPVPLAIWLADAVAGRGGG